MLMLCPFLASMALVLSFLLVIWYFVTTSWKFSSTLENYFHQWTSSSWTSLHPSLSCFWTCGTQASLPLTSCFCYPATLPSSLIICRCLHRLTPTSSPWSQPPPTHCPQTRRSPAYCLQGSQPPPTPLLTHALRMTSLITFTWSFLLLFRLLSLNCCYN